MSQSSCMKASVADELSYNFENFEHDGNLETTEKNKIFTTDTSHKKSPIWIVKNPKTINSLESDRPAYEYRIFSRFKFPRCKIATRSQPKNQKRKNNVEFRRSSITDVISSISSEAPQTQHSYICEEELTKKLRSNKSEDNQKEDTSEQQVNSSIVSKVAFEVELNNNNLEES